MVGWGTIIIWVVTSSCLAYLPSRTHRHSTAVLPPVFGRSSSPRIGIGKVRARRHYLHTLSSSNNDNIGDNASTESSAQDVRLFLTQRTIQSFMFLLASTRDLHTVGWLDRFVQPITINNYWNEDVAHKPGAGDTFRENDKRCAVVRLRDYLFILTTHLYVSNIQPILLHYSQLSLKPQIGKQTPELPWTFCTKHNNIPCLGFIFYIVAGAS